MTGHYLLHELLVHGVHGGLLDRGLGGEHRGRQLARPLLHAAAQAVHALLHLGVRLQERLERPQLIAADALFRTEDIVRSVLDHSGQRDGEEP